MSQDQSGSGRLSYSLEETVNHLKRSFDQQLQAQTEAVKTLLDHQHDVFRTSVNSALSDILKIYQDITRRQDNQAKATRFLAADVKEMRERMGLPPTDPPIEDL